MQKVSCNFSGFIQQISTLDKLPREKLSYQEVPEDQNIVAVKIKRKQKNFQYTGTNPKLLCLGLVHCTSGRDEIMLLKMGGVDVGCLLVDLRCLTVPRWCPVGGSQFSLLIEPFWFPV